MSKNLATKVRSIIAAGMLTAAPAHAMDDASAKAGRDAIETIMSDPHHYVYHKYKNTLPDVLNAAVDNIEKNERDGKLRVQHGYASRKVRINGSSVTIHVPLQQYLKDVAYGFIGGVHYERDEKLPNLLAKNFSRDDPNIDKIVRALRVELEKLPSSDTMYGKIARASRVFEFINDHAAYQFDESQGIVSRFLFNEKDTPYTRPFNDQQPDYVKSPTQFLIDGGGDCDDYSTIASHLLTRLGLPSYFVHLSYPKKVTNGKNNGTADHVVIGLKISKAEYNHLYNQGHTKLFARMIWDKEKNRFSSNNAKNYYWANQGFGSNMIVAANIGNETGYMMLLEPQSKGMWDGFGTIHDPKYANWYGDNTKIEQIIDPRDGNTDNGYQFYRWSPEKFERVEVHRNGDVKLFTNDSHNRGHFFNFKK